MVVFLGVGRVHNYNFSLADASFFRRSAGRHYVLCSHKYSGISSHYQFLLKTF